ncbi:MAG: hypothetical protein H7330_13835 [Hymenobacteraceae bacterium]|nr:hypothetical protein [Hymenobacteraceae bacterium]
MSEREPDPLFDVLRDRLGAHERAPASGTWAALAGQLAAAARRRRRRRGGWVAGGLLLMLVLNWSMWHGRAPLPDHVPQPVIGNASRSGKKDSRSSKALPRAGGDSSRVGGDLSLASGDLSLASGDLSLASGDLSLASGDSSLASSDLSLASSDLFLANGDLSLADGDSSRASSDLSRAAFAPDNAAGAGVAALVRRRPGGGSSQPVGVDTATVRLPQPAAASVRFAHRVAAAGWALLTPREVAIRLDTIGTFRQVSALVADSAHPVPPTVGPRWSIGLGLGFDLTHRRLTGAAAGPLERIERAAGAGQTAVSLGYALTPRLHVRAGVGYAAYRQAIRANLVRAGNTLVYVEQTVTGPDGQPIRTLSWQWVPTGSDQAKQPGLGPQTIRAQPTARYLTVPLLAEWHPRASVPRWRPVLAAGLVPHVLLSARAATLTRSCSCEPVPAALRSFALGLTAEAGVDYAFRPDLWLTLRPAATYLLANTAGPGQPTRHPWRVGLMVGLSWNPAPRPTLR